MKAITYYIEFLDAKNDFKKTVNTFNSFDEAKSWGIVNIPNYSDSIIRIYFK
jgi:hypothetical protein